MRKQNSTQKNMKIPASYPSARNPLTGKPLARTDSLLQRWVLGSKTLLSCLCVLDGKQGSVLALVLQLCLVKARLWVPQALGPHTLPHSPSSSWLLHVKILIFVFYLLANTFRQPPPTAACFKYYGPNYTRWLLNDQTGRADPDHTQEAQPLSYQTNSFFFFF